jgi:hypothetical protein
MENLVLPLAKAGLITLAILSGLGSIGLWHAVRRLST